MDSFVYLYPVFMTTPHFLRWDPSPYLIGNGEGFSLTWYGVIFVLGFALAYYFSKRIFIREKLPLKSLDSLLFLCLGLSILFARLVHVFFYDWAYYSQHPDEILLTWKGGLASHGGGLGLMLALFIWTRFNKQVNYWTILDIMAITTPLAGAFIRVGNFMNSEILGLPTDLPWAVEFVQFDGIPRHPAQLYEAICYLGIFAGMYLLYLRRGLETPRYYLYRFLFCIFSARFFIEFIKENQESFEHGWLLNMGQLLSIPFIIIGFAGMIVPPIQPGKRS